MTADAGSAAHPNELGVPGDGSPQFVRHTLRREGEQFVSRDAVNDVWDAVSASGALGSDWRGLPDTDAPTHSQVLTHLRSPALADWSTAAARVGFCAHPIRLMGSSATVDRATGEVTSTFSSADAPERVTYVRCGNRRADRCLSCSRLYAADTFHLIRAGVAGGKSVPETVGDNPLVFATLTAPSFGTVHVRPRAAGRCRPRRESGDRCPHGRPTACFSRHEPDDPELGQPLCRDCYDYDSHIVWQWWAPELWRRFTITLKRHLAQRLGVAPSRLNDVASVQYAKVAEYQRRGAVHFHALIRLDGPKSPEGFSPALSEIGAADLSRAIEQIAGSVTMQVVPPTPDGPIRVLAFGPQLDARVVRDCHRPDDPEAPLSGEQVAGYLAKYATKSANEAGARDNPHFRRLHATARQLSCVAHASDGDPNDDYDLLGKWAHTLGFRGHFATKSRRYSVTLGQLRRARQRAQQRIAAAHREGRRIDLRDLEAELLADDEDETTLVIGTWVYAGSGWADAGQTALATATAARAREYARERACARRDHHTTEMSDTEQGRNP